MRGDRSKLQVLFVYRRDERREMVERCYEVGSREFAGWPHRCISGYVEVVQQLYNSAHLLSCREQRPRPQLNLLDVKAA